MKQEVRLQMLEYLFESELTKRTQKLQMSLARQIRGTPETEKRGIFDAGLREWIASLAGCVGEFLPKFVIFHNAGTAERRLSSVEKEIRRNVYQFLGVADLLSTEAWPTSCRVLAFTRTVCHFVGDLLPAWFDLGFLGAASLSRRPPLFMEEERSREEIQHLYKDFAGELKKELFDKFLGDFLVATAPARTQSQRSRNSEEDVVLPDKKRDMSTYLDGAKLAPRQREIASLVLERGMKVGEVAKYLGLHRSTVAEGFTSASRKIDQSRENASNRENFVTRNPGRSEGQ
jgi:hypothetical protein